ncbi:GGDEF domain-containing protein [Desulfovibrio sp. OttesenSCG-928-F07]|nr:GGDEF domain-containing protein [Desulfovibrio sp. OttesenSCG-928-F07]
MAKLSVFSIIEPQSGFNVHHGDNDRYKRYTASLICTVFSVIFFLCMSFINFFNGHDFWVVLLLACTFVCIVSFSMQVYSQMHNIPSMLLCCTHTVLAWVIFTMGTENTWALLFSLVYPHAFMLWLGFIEGSIMSAFFIFSMVILSLPPIQAVLPNKYPPETLFRYIFVLFGVFSFAFFSELLRNKVQQKLVLLTKQVEKMAFTDPLTGLGNRLAFEQHYKREYAHFTRFKSSFCLIMGDIDHFKRINDLRGHAVGDAVLQHTAEIMLGRLRRQDGVFRWGGEEFILTLTGLGPRDVARIAEELRYAIAETPCPYQNESISYTMSFGVYSCNVNESPEQALEKVDALLYEAKRSGRNRIITDGNQT